MKHKMEEWLDSNQRLQVFLPSKLHSSLGMQRYLQFKSHAHLIVIVLLYLINMSKSCVAEE